MGTSVIYATEYIIGLVVFGLIFWLLDGILIDFVGVSTRDTVYYFAWYTWDAAVIIYLIFGMYYFYRSIKRWQILK